jgi:hypothetical protein
LGVASTARLFGTKCIVGGAIIQKVRKILREKTRRQYRDPPQQQLIARSRIGDATRNTRVRGATSNRGWPSNSMRAKVLFKEDLYDR